MSPAGADSGRSIDNRRSFLEGLGISWQHLVCAKQVHGGNIRIVSAPDTGKGALRFDDAIDDTDAFITDQRQIPMAIFTADCLPVFFYAPKRKVAAIAHAGWRSSYKGISAKVVCAMREVFAVAPGELLVWFGPSIRSCCYEVGGDFIKYFPGSLVERNGSCYLDLVRVNIDQAVREGVAETNIDPQSPCTYCCGDKFFSFRRQGVSCGRGMSVIMLK